LVLCQPNLLFSKHAKMLTANYTVLYAPSVMNMKIFRYVFCCLNYYQVLNEIQSCGSSVMLNVSDVYAACVSFGLVPNPVVTTVVNIL
jgi:hypothetical protein